MQNSRFSFFRLSAVTLSLGLAACGTSGGGGITGGGDVDAAAEPQPGRDATVLGDGAVNPTPDAAVAPTPDASVAPTPDAAPPTPDAAAPTPDAEAPTPDAAVPVCTDDERRCNGNVLEVCAANAWRELSSCPGGSRCESGECIDDSCMPDCNRKVCGDDGCGGNCGVCGAGTECVDGRCDAVVAACGDGACNGGETCQTCVADCGVCCGDGLCRRDQGETCDSCRSDCGCAGDEVCSADGRCVVACQPACDGRACGSNGCGGTCGVCPDDQICNANGACVVIPANCGDGACNNGEDCATCPGDCGACCGDDACTAGHGEDCTTCPADCGCPAGDVCDPAARDCVAACVPDCNGRQCGDDGCGGLCGRCAGGQLCDDTGACVNICQPNCVGRACGPDGCGGACGACGPGSHCDNLGQCALDCVPDCNGRNCGDDACNGSCGNCAPANHCSPNGVCVPDCVPDCAGKTCGSDGCGGTCGQCDAGEFCDVDSTCGPLCIPACQDKECGSNNCGGTCGECGANEECDPRGRCIPLCTPDCTGLDCGDDGCGGSCGDCAADSHCDAAQQCVLNCVPQCAGLQCGDDGCGGSCGGCLPGSACFGGVCERQFGCNCGPGERCLDGICRDPGLLCSVDNANGLCPNGQDCFAGQCVDAGAGCSPANPVGLCPAGQLCRNGACADIDQAALCDDRNPCTADVFDAVRNRCAHNPTNGAACSDGNACTDDVCRADVCTSTPRQGCVAPPVIDPYTSPTNVNLVNLAGTKPAGSSVEINGQVAVPESPDLRWTVRLNLVPGENVFNIRSLDHGIASELITVRIVYDNGLPVTSISPNGGVFLSGLSVTVACNESATVYYTTDGSTPDQYSDSFQSARTFRIFDDTTIKVRARDPAGNWEAAPVSASFTITGHGNRWQDLEVLPESLSLLAGTNIGSKLVVAGGTDGNAPQAGAYMYDVTTDAWTNLPALNIPRTQAEMVAVGGSVYILGGENEGIPLNQVQRIGVAPVGAAWENRQPMPTTRFGLMAAVSGTRIFAMGGKTNGGTVLTTVEVFDANANTWTNNVAQLPRARFAGRAVFYNNRIYVMGGENEAGRPLAEMDIYDINANAWSVGPALPTPRSFPVASLLQNPNIINGTHNGIVVAGGRLADGSITPIVEEWVAETNTWYERTPMPDARFAAAGGWVNQAGPVDGGFIGVWAIGGQGTSGLFDTLTRFSYDLDYTRRLAPLTTGRFLHGAVSLDRNIYLFGGRDFQEVLEGYIFDPETETYAAMPALPSAQNGLAAIAVNGTLYAIGGANQFGLSVPHVRVYDPADRTWTDKRPMSVARSEAAVTRVGSDIYVIGGENNGALQTVEIYDTVANTWRNGPLLPEARKGAMATSMDNVVYVFGGVDSAGAERNTTLRLVNGAWAVTAGASFTGSYGSAFPTSDNRITLLGGRRAGAISNTILRLDTGTNTFARQWLANTQFALALDRAGGTMHNGEIYLLGGNAGVNPLGPSGSTQVQKFNNQCFNGVLDPGEGQGANMADVGGLCGTIEGCAVLGDPQAAALARCRADGFTCDVVRQSVRGYRAPAGAGSDCNAADTWRFYCFANGDGATCGTNPNGQTPCVLGEIHGGHSNGCSCNINAPLAGTWCQ
jgi:N-acetylneuraminic acid mutarotase